MRQFDVFTNPSPRSRLIAPLVVVLQSHLLEDLPTAVVAPLFRTSERPPFTQVGLTVLFAGAEYALSLAELAATDARSLSRPLGSLAEYEDQIRRALDRLFAGF